MTLCIFSSFRLQNLMATAVIENLDFTNSNRFKADRIDENANSGEENEEMIDGECVLKKGEESNRKRGGRFQQVVHNYLGFGGPISTDFPKSGTTQEERRDFVVSIKRKNIV